ncbi:MAG: hypothetical protein Fur0022_37720 [Anaerolineales bacterium]
MHSSTELTISSAKLTGNNLVVFLSDGRVVFYPIAGMTWITDAPKDKQQDFTVTEWEIYWNQIDDGITLEHILSPKPRVDFTQDKAPNWEKVYEVVEKHKASSHSDKKRNCSLAPKGEFGPEQSG